MKVFDPVCAMEFDVEHMFAERTYDGQKWHFCSPECLRQFDEHPEKYAYPPAPEDALVAASDA